MVAIHDSTLCSTASQFIFPKMTWIDREESPDNSYSHWNVWQFDVISDRCKVLVKTLCSRKTKQQKLGNNNFIFVHTKPAVLMLAYMFIFLKFLILLPFIFSLVWWIILLCENWVNVLIGVWINYTNVKKCLLVLYLTPSCSYFKTRFFACVCFALKFASNARL